MQTIRAYLFDWDGVFNNGIKHDETGSPFSEIDAMGINLLRLGHWMRTGSFPVTAIITGEYNPSAAKLAQREHFDAVYLRFKDKDEALMHLTNASGIQAREVAFVFDDVLDLGLAAKAGLRFMVCRPSNPLLMRYVRNNNLCDYVTAHTGAGHAVREVCELLLGLTDIFELAVQKRSTFDATYRTYYDQRNQLPTRLWLREPEGIVELDGK